MASSAQQALQAKVKELQMRAKAAATANEALIKAKLVNPEVSLTVVSHKANVGDILPSLSCPSPS